MAAFSLDGEKICEVSGLVKWSSVERFSKDFEAGSIALYKLSSNYYVHAITSAKRAKFQLLKLGRIEAVSRDSRLMLSLSQDSTKNSGTVSIHLKEAVQSQLQLFLDQLNGVKAYFSAFKGKLSSLPSRDNVIQDIENQPCNANNSSVTSNRVHKYDSPLRSNLVSTSSSRSSQNVTPNRPPNYFAKQMNPPSSYSSQNKKTPLHDQTRARDNLNNTSLSSSSRSASSFYGPRNSWSPSERFSSAGKSLGPGLMPPPRPWSQTSRLVTQISFRSRDKRPFEKEVTLTGFSNLGNTCYMNAILQSLLGIPPFVQDLSSKSLLDQVHPQCLYRCLYNVLVCKRKCGNAEILRNSLRKLKRTISEAATRFPGYHQHDAHEFLCQVFDQLRDDVNSCNSLPSKSTSQEINSKTKELLHCPVTRSFESGVLHTISCKQCGECAPKEEIYHAFSLDIPSLCNSTSPSGTINMQTLIKKHFEDEELEYTCGKCDSKEAVISHSFSRLPRVLILHLKRYGYDNLTEEQEKKQDKVNIERFIALEMLCSSKTKAPLPFEYKPSLKLTPLKSRQKPQKRHFISEDDDDDDDDFRPSPPVRRKLDHSFSTTVTSSSAQESFSDPKVNSEDDLEITGTFKLDKIKESNTGVDDTNDKDFAEGKMDSQGNNLDWHLLGNKKPAWEGTEEEQMEWALSESAKSAGKKVKEQKIDDSQLDCTVAPPSEDSSLQRKRKSEVDAKITAECNSNGDVTATDYEKKCVQNNLIVDVSESEKPIWDGTEEEQLKWALVESAKLSAKKKCRDISEKEKEESPREWTRKSQSPTSVFEDNDFVLLSDLSDEDLASAVQECDTDEPNGLKGGGPIATDRCHDIGVMDGVSNVCVVNDENSNPQNCEDSGLEKNTAKSFLLKNSPIICVKRKNGHLQRKRRTLDGDVLNKTPSLEKFEGNLFVDEPKENKVSTNSAKPSSENKVSTNSVNPSSGTGSSWFKSSFSKFSDKDMEKAISMSLQDQQMSNVEDEELKRALQLSLQEFEGKEQPTSPANTGGANSENVTDSAPQDEECKVSTHSYRLVSIVSHLGSSSTSGHYISDVYDCNTKQWTSYDDSTASKLTEHGVRYKRQQSGYIFFYLYKQCVDAIENSGPSKENSQR